LDEERSTFYTGPRSWPISAGISLFGTSSTWITVILGNARLIPHELQLPAIVLMLVLFGVSLWMSILGGGSLLFRSPSDDLGTLTFQGRPLSLKTWTRILGICYLAPWIAILTVVLLVGTRIISRV